MFGLWDLIEELRTGVPEPKQLARILALLGALSLVVPIMDQIKPIPRTSHDDWILLLSYGFDFLVYVLFPVLCTMLFGAAYLLYVKSNWGKRLGQAAIAFFCFLAPLVQLWAGILVAANRNPSRPTAPIPDEAYPSLGFLVPIAIIFLMYLIPGYFTIRYMGRMRMQTESGDGDQPAIVLAGGPPTAYRSSPSPFGVIGTFLGMLVPTFLLLFAGKGFVPFGLLLLLLIFVGPIIYNFRASPFEEQREVRSSFWGGGAIYLFHASIPFFRLLIYADGLEVRVMLNRFFIPYDRMDYQAGLFKSSLLIKSHLPDVPSRLRFFGRTRAIIKKLDGITGFTG